MMRGGGGFRGGRGFRGGWGGFLLADPYVYSLGTIYEGLPDEYTEITVADEATKRRLLGQIGDTLNGKPIKIVVRPMSIAYNSIGGITL